MAFEQMRRTPSAARRKPKGSLGALRPLFDGENPDQVVDLVGERERLPRLRRGQPSPAYRGR